MPDKPEIAIVTPQFTRLKNDPIPAAPPADRAAWDALYTLDVIALREMGLGRWNDPTNPDLDDAAFGGRTLMLFPGEWYSSIPEGFTIFSIVGPITSFKPGVTDDDIRFGYLAYGVLV